MQCSRAHCPFPLIVLMITSFIGSGGHNSMLCVLSPNATPLQGGPTDYAGSLKRPGTMLTHCVSAWDAPRPNAMPLHGRPTDYAGSLKRPGTMLTHCVSAWDA